MDPEILDPERAPQAQQQSSDDLVALAERAFKGRVVKTTDGGPIEIAGPAGSVRVMRGPFGATFASFRGINVPIPPEKDRALDVLSGLATGALVVVEEHASPTLRRTHLVRVLDGRLHDVTDTTNDREDVPPKGAVYVVSFPAGLREASAAERKFIAKEMGGLVGRLKRKLVETVFEKAMGAVEAAAQNAQQTPSAPQTDDGRRKLGPK